MPPRELPHIGARLKAVREAAGLSQMELARKTGLSVSVVFQMEQGVRKDTKLTTIIAIAEVLGMTVGQLADELAKSDDPAPKKKPKGIPLATPSVPPAEDLEAAKKAKKGGRK